MIEHEVEGAAVRLVADINNSDASINEYSCRSIGPVRARPFNP